MAVNINSPEYQQALERVKAAYASMGRSSTSSSSGSGSSSVSSSSKSSSGSISTKTTKNDDSLLANRPKLTWTLGEAQDFLGMDEITEENIKSKFYELGNTGDESAKAALKTVFMAEHLTKRYEDDLLSLNQNMASILSSGGFDSVDEAANYVFRNEDGSSRYRFLSDDEQPELVRTVEYDLAAMEEAFRIKYAETLDTRNAASDPDAASRMVDLQKNAVIASEGSLLQGGVLPSNYLRKKSLYDLDSAGVLADGVLWAGTAKPRKGVGVVASASGATVKPINEQIGDYYGEKISKNQQGYLSNLKKETGLVGKYADWTDDQKFAAQNYISDARGGHDLSDSLIEMHAAGLSDEEIHAFQMEMSEALSSADFTEEAMDSWFEPAPEPEPVPETEPAPEPVEEPVAEMSIVDNRSEDMIFGNHIVTMEKVHAAINSGDWATAAELQYGLLVDMVARSDDKYVQELVHSEGSQKAAIALMQMVQKSGLPNRLDDSDIRAQLRVYEGYVLDALDIEQEPLTEFVQFLDNALNMNGRMVAAMENDGLGFTQVMQWAMDNTAYRVTDIANKFIGMALIGTGRVFGQDSWVKTGEEIASEQSATLSGMNQILMEKGTPLEILAGQVVSETAKMYTFGAASQWISKGNAVFFGEKLKWLQRVMTSVPFSAESGIQEFHEAYTETNGDVATSYLSSLGAFSASTLANQFDGILPNLEASGMPYIGEVVDKLNAIPGSGVKVTIARWGQAGKMWLWNLAKTCVNEGMQEGAENILTTAVTDAIKGGSIFDRDWDEYSKEVTADMLMGGIISVGSGVSVMPAYSRSVQVAESMMRKSAVTMADVGTLMDAMAQDLRDPAIAEEVRERASAAAIESRTGELISSGAVDSSKATMADKLRREAQAHFASAQREEQRTKALMQQANERMKANGNDKESTKATLEAIEAHKNAGLTLREAEEKLAKANQTYEEESAAVRAEAQEMAKQEIGEQLLARQQERQQREVAREQQRQDANADVLDVDDFIATDLAAEGWDPTPEEREQVARLMKERRDARMKAAAQNEPAEQLTVPKTNKRFISAIEKKFGTKVTVLDTSKGGTVLRYNGAYDPRTDSIVIDSNATQSDLIYGTMLHELTHKAEKSQTYKEFASAILRLKYGQDDTRLAADIRAKQESYNRGLAAMAQLDESVDATPLTAEQASREIVADLTREILYGDEASINQLVAEQPSVARRMLDTIKNFIRKLAGTNDPALDQLNKTRELFEKALGESTQQMKPREKRSFPTDNIQYSLREEEPPKKTIKGYKVFAVFPNKPGELYPPMVANPGGADTPVGVWLNADAAPSAGETKTGRPQVQAGGKGTNTGKQKLAYRPGWHLGDFPRATQFNRLNPETGKKELFPENFVWAECDVAADLDYQEEAMSYGYNAKGNFQHSLAGLPRLPREEDGTAGFYRYRTNPNPDTVPWIISGAIKVNRILDDNETRAILNEQKQEFMSSEDYASLSDADKQKALERFNYIERKGGDIDLAKFGLTAGEVDSESRVQYSLNCRFVKHLVQ